MTAVLYSWPPAAAVGRPVAKGKIYEHRPVGAPVRERFVSEVQRITWAYKLAESTVNLPGTAAVPEFQVFHVDAKGADVSEAVLMAIDQAVKTPIVFEVVAEDAAVRRVRMVASHKQLGSGMPKLGRYYTTRWQPEGAERRALPPAISLAGLYTAVLEPLTPTSLRPGEDVSQVVARLGQVRRLEREVAALERKLRNEPQLNRQVELRRALRAKQAELEMQR